MKASLRKFSNGFGQPRRSSRYLQTSTTGSVPNAGEGEESRRQQLQNDMFAAQEKGLRVCRLWQLCLVLNLTIIIAACVLVILLLFIIGPLSPYQTYGQPCRTAPCDRAQGLACDTRYICACPSSNSYWSNKESACRECPYGWSMVSGKCLFVSTFYLNWTEAFTYCGASTAQLLTLSPIELYPSLTLAQISSLAAPSTDYFIGLSEQPNESGNWHWVDGNSLTLASTNLFCTNGSMNFFDTFFRTYMTCGMYRKDVCLARGACERVDLNFILSNNLRLCLSLQMSSALPDLEAFLHDDRKEHLVVYEVEVNESDNPNDKLRAYAKSRGQCACRLSLILVLVNLTVVIVAVFLILLLLIEVGAVPPYQTYGKQCATGICDWRKRLECASGNQSKTCRCPQGNWFWSNNDKCLECPPNWIVSRDGTGCYFVSYTRLNFTDANLWCAQSQGRLAELTDERTFVALQSREVFQFNLADLYWIGLREIGVNQSIYRWVTSRSIFTTPSYFCSGYPVHAYNYYFQQYDQCVGLYVHSNTSTCLRDFTCPNAAPFICELY